MRIFKTKWFNKWADDEKLSDEAVRKAVEELAAGLVDADLGGHIYKKRMGLPDRGKRGSVRVLLAFKIEERAFFIYGFSKNKRTNIKTDELWALKAYARELLGYSEAALEKALKAKVLIEVNNDER